MGALAFDPAMKIMEKESDRRLDGCTPGQSDVVAKSGFPERGGKTGDSLAAGRGNPGGVL
ncbi:MAG: hypothetical protein JXR49_01505 [Acidobacteria bacterium]|nr:hypothetical protein [Acidobacteriota bacterium]